MSESSGWRIRPDILAVYGFEYPHDFERLLAVSLTAFEPWYLYRSAHAEGKFDDVRQRYPERRLVPFAARQDGDDVACFDLDATAHYNNPSVSVIEYPEAPGFEQLSSYSSIGAWLHAAIDDMLQFE